MSAESIRPPMTREEKDALKERGRRWKKRAAELAARIVSDPALLGGAPHIRGTKIATREVEAAWSQRGVRINDIRRRFRQLSDDDIEAALFHSPSTSEPAQLSASYIAEWSGPPHRKLYLTRQHTTSGSFAWKLEIGEFDELDGEELPFDDVVEFTLAQIVRYPEQFAPREIEWRDHRTNEVVDIYALKDA